MIVRQIRRGKGPFDEFCPGVPGQFNRPMRGFDAGSFPPSPPGNFHKDTNVCTDIKQSPASRRANEPMQWQQVFFKRYDTALALLDTK